MRWLSPGLMLFWLGPLLLGITTPAPGAVLRGPVNISGSNQVQGATFLYAEVSFSYVNDPTGPWFLIATNDQPIEDGILATWDTTSITDGDYALRLRVFLQDGTSQDVTVADLHVRNDVAAATATPPVAAADLPTFAPALPTPTDLPVSATSAFAPLTPLPDNPAALTDKSVLSTFRRGAIFAVIAFALIGIFIRLRTSR